MQIIHTIAELRASLKQHHNIGFVPTMGNLHEGHCHLAEIAKKKADCVVVSIFVNPLQFGKNEDLAKYPRTLAEDCDKLQRIGVDYVFAPNAQEMYPEIDGEHLNQTMMITVPPIASELCGASRPGHFAGVATVVMKLFNIVRPSVAIFGKKDFQQLFVIRELVRQFNLPIEIIGSETIREESGLAMSSRNGYLTAADKLEAPRLNKVLKLIIAAVQKEGKKITLEKFKEIEQTSTDYLTQLGWEVDYISIRSALTLKTATPNDVKLVVLAAVKLGSTRLIDNMEFTREG